MNLPVTKSTMASAREQRQKSVYLKSGALALVVGILAAVAEGLRTSTTRFSMAEFAFAFILTYTIAFGVFSKDGQP
jgi:hypothetical protein